MGVRLDGIFGQGATKGFFCFVELTVLGEGERELDLLSRVCRILLRTFLRRARYRPRGGL